MHTHLLLNNSSPVWKNHSVLNTTEFQSLERLQAMAVSYLNYEQHVKIK